MTVESTRKLWTSGGIAAKQPPEPSEAAVAATLKKDP